MLLLWRSSTKVSSEFMYQSTKSNTYDNNLEKHMYRARAVFYNEANIGREKVNSKIRGLICR